MSEIGERCLQTAMHFFSAQSFAKQTKVLDQRNWSENKHMRKVALCFVSKK